ncbi:MAG: hypothetical protein ING59_12535 [Burkholderiales bacterium]|nr:hypothetical protein [Burkholderiales bacterium]
MKYASVPTRIWLESRFLALKPNTQRVHYALWTGPEVLLCGITTATPAVIAGRLALSVAAARRAVDELAQANFLTVDREAPLIWLHRFIEEQLGGEPMRNRKHLVNTVHALSGLPQTNMVEAYRAAYSIPLEVPARQEGAP